VARPPRGFTAHDTPEVVQRIASDLGRALLEVRQADPGLRALVLTGGFARGEGAVLRGAPVNDYDLLALRGLAPPRNRYPAVRASLEEALGLHLDLQPVWAGRLGFARPSVFWYETALRGHTLWGDAGLLARIPVRTHEQLDAREGLRLLANRAAGLLLGARASAHDRRLQAAKALLAALDANLLAGGAFAPSQRERWELWRRLREAGEGPARLEPWEPSLRWAIAFKLDPAAASGRDPDEAWRAGAHALLDAVQPALRAARMRSLEAYARADDLVENLPFRLRSRAVPGARPWALHPTGRVRAAGLLLLAERVERAREFEAGGRGARSVLARVVRGLPQDPELVPVLERLRGVTLP